MIKLLLALSLLTACGADDYIQPEPAPTPCPTTTNGYEQVGLLQLCVSIDQ